MWMRATHVNAAVVLSDSFSGGYNTSLWTIFPGQFAPIASPFGITVNPAHGNDYSSLVHDGTLPKNIVVKIEMKIKALPASDMGFFVSNAAFNQWKNAYIFGIGNGGVSNTILLRDSSIPGGVSGAWTPTVGTHSVEINISGGNNSIISYQ